MILKSGTENIEKAASLIRAGDLVAFPTETVYGLGADATNSSAVGKIFALKGRPLHNPLIVHIAKFEQLEEVVDLKQTQDTETLLKKLSCFWPGPLSVVLKRSSNIPAIVSAGNPTVAVRIPNHPVALEFLKACQRPVAAPSANRSNYISPTCAKHVEDEFEGKLEIILDGGECQVGIESTVLSLVEPTPTILRLGSISKEALSEKLGQEVLIKSGPTTTLSSPGQLALHYSPNTPLVIKGHFPEQNYPKRVGLVLQSPNSKIDQISYSEIRYLSQDGSAAEIAHNLYAVLRELDQLQLDLIVVEPCSAEGTGLAVMDRLIRAGRSS